MIVFLFGFIFGGLIVAICVFLAWLYFKFEQRLVRTLHKYSVEDGAYHIYSKTKEQKNED